MRKNGMNYLQKKNDDDDDDISGYLI